MIKLTWVPNTEADIDNYEVWKAPDNVNFVKIADVDHDLGNPAVYDATIGRFFYEDATGTGDDWYKIRAEDSSGNFSSFTVSKQAGPPTPPICVLFGTVLTPNGVPVTDAQVQIYIENRESTKDGQFVNSYGIRTNPPLEVFTDDAGFWEADVIREAIVRVVIPPINLDTEVQIPDAASAEITTLL